MNNRRTFLQSAAAGTIGAGAVMSNADLNAQEKSSGSKSGSAPKFRYCLNTSTIRGQKLGLAEQIELAAKVGYEGIEIWLGDVEEFIKQGGNLEKLRTRLAELGLQVESAIAFANWIVDDDQKREEGLNAARRDMALVRALGGRRIAAPPAGATDKPGLDLAKAGQRYRALLEVGREYDVVPMLEVWGFSKNLSRLSEVLYVATEAAHPDACVLPDIYHLYKGGTEFCALPLLAGTKIHVFHMNDYPSAPPRETITDADRVYPTDGIAPISEVLQSLVASGFDGVLSLELFNKTYWEQDAELVVRTGLEKMKLAVSRAFA